MNSEKEELKYQLQEEKRKNQNKIQELVIEK